MKNITNMLIVANLIALFLFLMFLLTIYYLTLQAKQEIEMLNPSMGEVYTKD